MALTFTIGVASGVGQSYLPYVDFRSIVVENSVEVAADSFDFQLHIYNKEINPPVAGQEVIFKDSTTTEFAGIIIKVRREFLPESLGIIYSCQCFDYVYFLNRRLVNETYQEQAADVTVKAILTDLSNASNSDQHYAFFKNNVTKILTAPILRELTFDKVLPSQAFDQIAQATGFQWWIGFDKNVYFRALNVTDATQLLDFTLNIDDDIATYFDYYEEESIDDIGTQLILKDVTSKSTTSQVDEFKGSEGKDHNNETNKIFYLNRVPFGFLGVLTVKLNNSAQTLKFEDIEGTINDGTGGSSDVFVWVGENTSYVRFSSSNTVIDGDDIEVTYDYEIVDDSEGGLNIEAVEEMKRRTQGDGIHQFIFTQASGLKFAKIEDIDAIEQILLFRKSTILIRGEFDSWLKGWEAGQNFRRRWDQEGLSDTMFVISVTKTILTPADDPNLSDNVILSHIVFSNIPHGVAV